jgi:hypothetical protein
MINSHAYRFAPVFHDALGPGKRANHHQGDLPRNPTAHPPFLFRLLHFPLKEQNPASEIERVESGLRDSQVHVSTKLPRRPPPSDQGFARPASCPTSIRSPVVDGSSLSCEGFITRASHRNLRLS